MNLFFRNKVKDFAQTTANTQRADGKKCPKFKLIVLDEADSMTKSAQEALRRTMELYRFLFIGVFLSKIQIGRGEINNSVFRGNLIYLLEYILFI